MIYTNTAAKLRPKTFEELKGQKFIVSTISSSIENDTIAPAFLLSGPRGVGKTSTARLIALAINRPQGTPVNTLDYEGSEDIRLGKSLDVIEIDGASYTSVENVRNIREEILYAPVHFKYKVYIIDEVHMLSNSAFNALLKTIEEPPPYVVFIFATTELHKVPATIRSRCQQFSFRLISMEEMSTQLEKICQEEKISADPAVLQWIAKEAQGSFRDAYTLFDQIKAYSGSTITIEHIKTYFGLAGLDTLNELFTFCLKGEREQVLSKIDELITYGVSVEQLVVESAEYIRSQLFIKTGITASDVLGFPVSLYDTNVGAGFSSEQLERALALLLECYRNLKYSVNVRFEVELVFSQLCEISHYITPHEIVDKLTRLKPSHTHIEHKENHNTVIPSVHAHNPDNTPTLPSINTQDDAIHKNENHTPPSEKPLQETLKSTEPTPHSRSQKTDSSPVPHTETEPDNPTSHTQSQSELYDYMSNTNALWSEIVSTIQLKNEGLAIVLESAGCVAEKGKLFLTFDNDYSYGQFKKFERRICVLAEQLAKTPIEIHAHMSTHNDTHQLSTPSQKTPPRANPNQEPEHNNITQTETTHPHIETPDATIADDKDKMFQDVFGATKRTHESD